jgi:hypothetical protein
VGRASPNPRPRKALFGGQPVLNFRTESSRRNFIKGAAVVGVGASFVAVTAGDRTAFAQGYATDLEILNFALTLEFLEAEFYVQGLEAGLVSGRELELVTPIRDHELAHAEDLQAVIQQLGGTPTEEPEFMFPDETFANRQNFLEAASMFEELGVTAYHGQVPNIESPEILGAAAAIAGVESRHAAVIADLLGADPFPAPFEDNRTMDEVLELAGQFIAS